MAEVLTNAALTERMNSLTTDLDTWWLLFGAVLVFFMQTGFCMLEVGSVSVKNTKNLLIKNIGEPSISAICFWLLGYGFAFGEDKGGFIGKDSFALRADDLIADDGTLDGYTYATWLFQWAFAATAATIVSGAVAERVSWGAFVTYSIVLTSFIYPVVVHWGWSGNGWATPWNEVEDDLLFGCGVIDFAGSGVVHMTGGCAALTAAVITGPRIGRFNADGTSNSLPQQSAVLQTLGTLFLWFGWYGFNGVSTLYIVGYSAVAAKVMVVSTIAGAAAALTNVGLTKLQAGYWDAGAANNGILAGLVSITGGCSVVEPYAAFIIGVIGACVYFGASNLLVKLKVDDVVDAVPVHLACGIWGVIAPSLFATADNYSASYYATYDGSTNPTERVDKCKGAFYGGDGSGLGAAICFILANLAWTLGTTTILFTCVDKAIGMRVSKEVEEIGMDDSKHGGQTYPEMRRDKPGMENGSAQATSVV